MKNYNKPTINENEELFFEPVLAAYNNPFDPTCIKPSEPTVPSYDSGDSVPEAAPCTCPTVFGVKVWNIACPKHGWFK